MGYNPYLMVAESPRFQSRISGQSCEGHEISSWGQGQGYEAKTAASGKALVLAEVG